MLKNIWEIENNPIFSNGGSGVEQNNNENNFVIQQLNSTN